MVASDCSINHLLINYFTISIKHLGQYEWNQKQVAGTTRWVRQHLERQRDNTHFGSTSELKSVKEKRPGERGEVRVDGQMDPGGGGNGDRGCGD